MMGRLEYMRRGVSTCSYSVGGRRIRVVHVYPDCILKSVMYPEVRGRIHAFLCILLYLVCIPVYSGKCTGYDQNTQNTVYPNVSRPKYGGPSRIRSEYAEYAQNTVSYEIHAEYIRIHQDTKKIENPPIFDRKPPQTRLGLFLHNESGQ